MNLIKPNNNFSILEPVNNISIDSFMMVFDELPFMVMLFDQNGEIILANNEAVKVFDLRDKTEQNPHLKILFSAAYNSAKSSRGEMVNLVSPIDGASLKFYLKKLPTQVPSETFVLVTGYNASLSFYHELSEKNYRLNEAAALANAVTLKVKDPLAGIELYASRVAGELSANGDTCLADMLGKVLLGVKEVNEYLTSFESMSKPLILDINRHNLVDIMDRTLNNLQPALKEKNIGLLLNQESLVVDIDEILIGQVFFNIVFNAIEAMPNGGRLEIDFKRNEFSKQAEVIITDNGDGISMMELTKIFSPFYTTKDRPLGLGLPVSQRIMEAHQGALTIVNAENYGAQVTIIVPSIPEVNNALNLN